MKLGVDAVYKNLGRVRIWEFWLPGVHTSKHVVFSYDVGKMNAGCLIKFLNLVLSAYFVIVVSVFCGLKLVFAPVK